MDGSLTHIFLVAVLIADVLIVARYTRTTGRRSPGAVLKEYVCRVVRKGMDALNGGARSPETQE